MERFHENQSRNERDVSPDEIAINNKRKPFEEWQKDLSPVPIRGCTFELRGEDPEQRAALEVAQPASELCSASRREVRPKDLLRNPRNGKDAFGVRGHWGRLRVGKVSRYMTARTSPESVRSSYSKGADRTEEVIIAQNVAVPFLVIDEIGVGFGSAHETAMIHDTITKRYEAWPNALLISNLSQKALADYLGRANP